MQKKGKLANFQYLSFVPVLASVDPSDRNSEIKSSVVAKYMIASKGEFGRFGRSILSLFARFCICRNQE